MVAKGQRGESCGGDAPPRLLHIDVGGRTRCQGHLSLSLCPWTLTVGAHTTQSGSDSQQPPPDPEMTPASSSRRGVVETPGGPASTPGHPEPRCPPASAPAMVRLRPRGPTGAGITWLEVPRSQSVSPRTSPPPCPPNQACGPGCCHSALPPSQWQGVGWGLGGLGF